MLTIYKITIESCDKIYIGSTTNYKQRTYQHKDYSKYYFNPNLQLYFLIREYGGWDKCLMEIVEENSNKDREQYWIDYYGLNVLNIRNPNGLTTEEKQERNVINSKTYYNKLKNDKERYKKKQDYMKEYHRIRKVKINNTINNDISLDES